jgi:hypothetical protein
MKLQDRNLSLKLKGEDVELLQKRIAPTGLCDTWRNHAAIKATAISKNER